MNPAENVLKTETDKLSFHKKLPSFVLGFVLLLFLLIVSHYNYLIFHSLAEFFSIAVAWSLFMLTWNSREFIENDALVFIGIAYLFIGGTDLIHTLSYKGMGVLAPEGGANPATQLWIAARFMESVSLFVFPFLFFKRVKIFTAFAVYASVITLILVSIFLWDIFPSCYVEGVGLTLFKKSSEYVICLILIASLVLFWQRRDDLDPTVFCLMVTSIILTIMGELAFTFYVSVYGLSNLAGHFLKIISFFLIYSALVRSTLKMPYATIFRKLKEREAELEENVWLLNEVGRIAKVGGWEMDMTTRTAKWTQGTYDIVEIERGQPVPGLDEHIGYYLEEYRPLVNNAMQSLIEEDKPLAFDAQFRTAKGNIRWCRAIGCAVREEGKCVRLHGTFQDITEIRHAEEALKKSEARYRQMFETNQAIKLIIDPEEGAIIEANDAACWFYGYSRNEILKKKISDINILPHNQLFRELKKAKSEHCLVFYFSHRLKSGEIRDVEVYSGPISIGSKIFLHSIIHDITDRRKAEDALRKSERRLRQAHQLAKLGHWDWETVTDRLIWSKEVYAIFGQDIEKFQPTLASFESLIHSDDYGAFVAERQAALDNDRAVNIVHRIILPDGTVRYVRELAEVIRDEAGEVRRFMGTVQDITENKLAEKEKASLEAQLRQAHKMEAIGKLAGGIAHEFNNLLSIIVGNIELATEDIPEDDPVQEFLREVLKASMRGKEIILQLLSFSRPTRQKREAVDICAVVNDALKFLRASVPNSFEFRGKISEDCHAVLGDPTQVHQVVINLCNNAVQAMSEAPGVLEINLNNLHIRETEIFFDQKLPPGDYVCLQISDKGPGIKPGDLSRIFDPFYTTKEVGKGSGMGLAVVHGIMKGHNGGIRVSSVPDHGAVFECYFPSSGKTETRKQESQTAYPRGKERILYLDDEDALVRMAGMRLERLGYHAKLETDPERAIKMFRENPEAFDLVITDLTMPGLTGDRVIRKLRETDPDIKIIICSGYSEKIDDDKARGIGANAYLMKPNTMRDLALSIRKVLDG